MKLADVEGLRREMDSLIPDCRAVMNNGLDPEGLAAIFLSSMLKGQAALLRRDDIPWSDLAVDPVRRRGVAVEVEAVANLLLSSP